MKIHEDSTNRVLNSYGICISTKMHIYRPCQFTAMAAKAHFVLLEKGLVSVFVQGS